jgi:hypothetical protein
MEIHKLTGFKLTKTGTAVAVIAGAAILYYLWKKSKK